MQLEPTACPGRTDLARLEGECRACSRLDNSAPVTAVPRTVWLQSLQQWVCEGRRFHAQSISETRQFVAVQGRGLSAAFVSSAGDAL